MTQTTGYNAAKCFLRTAQAEDEEFLYRLFAETQGHLAAFQSNEALYRSLIEMQYEGRKQSYATEFPQAIDAILCLEDEARGAMPVGRILVNCQLDCWRIVDIAVLAAHRGNGLGSWVLNLCKQRCQAAGARLALQVRPENPAHRLYERLGFRVTRQNAFAMEMELAIPYALDPLQTEALSAAL